MLRCSAIGCDHPAESRVVWTPPKMGDHEVIYLCRSCLKELKKALAAMGLEIISEEIFPEVVDGPHV